MTTGVACGPWPPDPALIPLHEWESFYVIIGTSAAALTGLMFVVIAVVADAGPRAASPLGHRDVRHADHRPLLRSAC